MTYQIVGLVAGNYAAAEKQINDERSDQDAVLYAELARVQQTAGDYKASLAIFQKAIQLVEKQNMANKGQGNRAAATTVSMLINDKSIPYIMPGFAQVFLY